VTLEALVEDDPVQVAAEALADDAGNGQVDGAVSADGRVAGCYIHGLLADDRQRQHWLERIGGQASAFAYESDVDATLDLLADHLEKHIDCDRLLELAREPRLRE